MTTPDEPGQAGLRKRIKEIAETWVRCGYRRIHVLLRREGWQVNAKRAFRLYREMGLQLRNKTPKRRMKAKLRSDRTKAVAANGILAMDFLHDQLFDGMKIRVLAIVGTLSRVSSAVHVRHSYRRSDGVECSNAAPPSSVTPGRSASTTAPEFVSKEFDLWVYMKGVTLDFSRPGKPTDNAFIESFKGKFRAGV